MSWEWSSCNQPHFILCLSKLPLNRKCSSLSRELAVELTPTQPSVGQVRGNVARSWAQWCVGVTWAGQSSAVPHVSPWLLGQTGRGTEGCQWIFSHLCLCCLMSLFWFCFLKIIFYFNLSTCVPEDIQPLVLQSLARSDSDWLCAFLLCNSTLLDLQQDIIFFSWFAFSNPQYALSCFWDAFSF